MISQGDVLGLFLCQDISLRVELRMQTVDTVAVKKDMGVKNE